MTILCAIAQSAATTEMKEDDEKNKIIRDWVTIWWKWRSLEPVVCPGVSVDVNWRGGHHQRALSRRRALTLVLPIFYFFPFFLGWVFGVLDVRRIPIRSVAWRCCQKDHTTWGDRSRHGLSKNTLKLYYEKPRNFVIFFSSLLFSSRQIKSPWCLCRRPAVKSKSTKILKKARTLKISKIWKFRD